MVVVEPVRVGDMSLPIFNGVIKDVSLLQTSWSAMLNPVINRATNQANVLENVSLKTGTNVVNHLLGRRMQGWFIVDLQGIATIYRSAPFDNLTLTLTSSAPVIVNIGVF